MNSNSSPTKKKKVVRGGSDKEYVVHLPLCRNVEDFCNAKAHKFLWKEGLPEDDLRGETVKYTWK
jgi:hypothetical protein